MSDHPQAQTPFFDADDTLRMARFMAATIASMFVLAGLTTLLVHASSPESGWTVAMGVGAMIGFWMCPLAGAVVGNGYHEIATDRATHATPPETAQPTSHAGRLEQHGTSGRTDDRVSVG